MALARKLSPRPNPVVTHKTWRDPGGSRMIACTVSPEAALMRLAADAERVILREPPGHRADARTLAQIVDALSAVKLLTGPGVRNPEAVLRRLRLILGDRLARLRIIGSFHFLAGSFEHETEAGQETVLLIVPASRHVSSCDWQLAL